MIIHVYQEVRSIPRVAQKRIFWAQKAQQRWDWKAKSQILNIQNFCHLHTIPVPYIASRIKSVKDTDDGLYYYCRLRLAVPKLQLWPQQELRV